MIFRSPLGFAIALFVAFSVATCACFYVALEYDMAIEPLIAGGVTLVAALLVTRDLRSYRLGDEGLEIQHLLTRGIRVIPYRAMREIKKAYTARAYRYAPRQEEVLVHHPDGMVTVPFFHEDQRDEFAAELQRRIESARPDGRASVGS